MYIQGSNEIITHNFYDTKVKLIGTKRTTIIIFKYYKRGFSNLVFLSSFDLRYSSNKWYEKNDSLIDRTEDVVRNGHVVSRWTSKLRKNLFLSSLLSFALQKKLNTLLIQQSNIIVVLDVAIYWFMIFSDLFLFRSFFLNWINLKNDFFSFNFYFKFLFKYLISI